MSKLTYFAGCFLLISTLLSCRKSDSYDVKGDVPVKFFTNNESLGNAPQNSITYAVVNIPNVAGSGLVNLSTTLPAAIRFPVFATKPVEQSVIIGATLDNSLIAKYNEAKGTSYEPFPAGVISASTLSVTIPAGATVSSDSLALSMDATKLNTLTSKAYMAPVMLTTVSNPSAGEITTTSTTHITYIVVNTELRQIKYLAPAADALGTLITPRTAWSVIFTPAPTTVGSVTDGSTTTFSRWTASPVLVDVNLQATKNVTGIRLYTSNNATHIPTAVEVSLSNDGINYDIVGAPLRADLTYASSYNYILFYKAIPAKYVRLKLTYTTSTNTQNFRITELDIYAN